MKFAISPFPFSHTYSKQRGFTLIELLLVLSLMGVLFAIGSFNFTTAQHTASLKTTVDTFLADMRAQQLKAMTGDTEGTGTNTTYGIHFDTDSYTLFRGTYTAGDSANYTVTLPGNIQITTFSLNGNNLIFQKGSGNVASFSIQQSITIQDISANTQKTITTNKYGVITSIQ